MIKFRKINLINLKQDNISTNDSNLLG